MSQSGNAVIFDRIKDKIGIVVVSAAQYKEKLSHAYTWDNTGKIQSVVFACIRILVLLLQSGHSIHWPPSIVSLLIHEKQCN